MTFSARKLTEFEATTFNFGALGIPLTRVPPKDWLWAIDEGRDALFTQLVSSSHEMRDGLYYYLLLVRGKPALVRIDGWRNSAVAENRPLNVIVENFQATADCSADLVKRLSSEAQLVLIAYRTS